MAVNNALNTATVPISVSKGGTGLSATTINQILYSSSNNVLAGLATANNSVLVTDGSGVPSMSSTLPAAVLANISAIAPKLTGYVRTTLSNNDIKNMYDTPVLVLAAPGAGLVIMVQQVVVELIYSGTPFATGTGPILQYSNTVHGAGNNSSATISSADITASQNQIKVVDGITNAFSGTSFAEANLGLYMSNTGANFTAGGASTINIHVLYSIYPTSI